MKPKISPVRNAQENATITGGAENTHVWITHVWMLDTDDASASPVDLTPYPGVKAAIQHLPANDPNRVLVHHNRRDRKLFDVYSIAALAESLFPGKGAQIARQWRTSQVDYTRLRTLSGRYEPFSKVTRDALRHACATCGVTSRRCAASSRRRRSRTRRGRAGRQPPSARAAC